MGAGVCASHGQAHVSAWHVMACESGGVRWAADSSSWWAAQATFPVLISRIAARREDPTIFGYNLMNEPRSQRELYLIRRQTTDGSKMYNISYNPANDLQSWIEDMASYVKSIDPIHLLSTGESLWRSQGCWLRVPSLQV